MTVQEFIDGLRADFFESVQTELAGEDRADEATEGIMEMFDDSVTNATAALLDEIEIGGAA